MKFHNGCWLLKEGYGSFSPQMVYEIKTAEDKIELCMPTRKIVRKGDTLDGVNLTLQVSAPMPEMLRVKVIHHKGIRKKTPEFALTFPKEGVMEVQEDEASIQISSGHLSLLINKETVAMQFLRDGKLLTRSTGRDLSYISTNWTGLPYASGKEDSAYLCQQLNLSVGELIYGLGERFTPLVKNGQSVSIWNEDGGTSTEQSYKNIPFYLSNRGFGIFVNHPEKVEFEIATEQVTKAAFSVQGESLEYFVINGPTMKDVLMRYTDLTGKPARLSPWSYGLWLSTSFTTNYDEKTVMEFIDGMEAHGIPLSVFHFDCCWMRNTTGRILSGMRGYFLIRRECCKELRQKEYESVSGLTPISGRNRCFLTKASRRAILSKRKTVMRGSGICGSRDLPLSILPTPKLAAGTKRS